MAMSDYYNNNQGGENQPGGQGYVPPSNPYGYGYQNQNQNPYYYGTGNGQGGGGEQPPKKPKKKNKLGLVITATALTGVVAGALVTGLVVAPVMQGNLRARELPAAVSAMPDEAAEQPRAGQAEAPELGGSAPQIQNPSNPVPEVAENAKKSVVQVLEFQSNSAPGAQIPDEQQIASGSGFVISEDGYIMTNNHVVADGNSFKVKTSDGTEYPAELVGRDPSSEVAVLKVEGLNLPALPIGNSDEAVTGEMVIAIGNPLGEELQNTVTVGYLSAVSRQVTNSGQEMTMLQTDAAINPGNSGGPLLNTAGEVIGINTMKSISAGYDSYGNNIAAEGIGFAIPITQAMDVAQTLIRDGSIPRPGIGVSYALIDAETAAANGVVAGAYVQQVAPGSPAAEAGIKAGDIITQLEGQDLSQPDAKIDLSGKQAGDKVSAVVWRDGKSYDVELQVVDLNQLQQQNQLSESKGLPQSGDLPEGGEMPDISGLLPDISGLLP